MQQLKILNIFNLYTLRVGAETHPFIYKDTKLNRPEHNHTYTPVSQIHKHCTRYSQHGHQYIPAGQIDYTTKRNTQVWNSIPAHIRTIQKLKPFKSALRKHLQQLQDQ